MKRKIEKDIINWLEKDERKPLIIEGARQIGKTYVIENVCIPRCKKFIKFDFIQNKDQIDDANIENFETLIERLQLKYNFSFDNPDTIVFFDEIQECPNLIQNLKYLKIKFPTAKIICSGSLLGVRYKSMNISFPVGYVEKFIMYSMDFEEFLIATGSERYIPIIKKCYEDNKPIDTSIHNELLNLYNRYLYLGGMPEVIQNYIDSSMDVSKMDRNIIKTIIDFYKEDMIKYASSNNESIRIQRIYDNIVPQLSKENPKFQYAKLDKKDNRKIDYVSPLDWLINSNIILQCNEVSKPEYPLNAYKIEDSYKLYVNDVGILGYLADMEPTNVIFNEDYSFKGKLAENYVIQSLISNNKNVLYYSEKNKSNKSMEIDFLIQLNGKIIPIEVKAGTDSQSKSLKSYMSKFNYNYAIRISAKNFGLENDIKSIPLYATFCIKDKYN